MKTTDQLIPKILIFFSLNIMIHSEPIDHEIVRIESLCESSSQRWNGCPKNSLSGWQNHASRLTRWYKFRDSNNLQMLYIAYLRYRTKQHNNNFESLIYLRYGQILAIRSCQLSKSMSAFEVFQRLIAWVMIHSQNPIRSGQIEPYFAHLLSLEKMLARKKPELQDICSGLIRQYQFESD